LVLALGLSAHPKNARDLTYNKIKVWGKKEKRFLLPT
jgi:hypothetical protein